MIQRYTFKYKLYTSPCEWEFTCYAYDEEEAMARFIINLPMYEIESYRLALVSKI